MPVRLLGVHGVGKVVVRDARTGAVLDVKDSVPVGSLACATVDGQGVLLSTAVVEGRGATLSERVKQQDEGTSRGYDDSDYARPGEAGTGLETWPAKAGARDPSGSGSPGAGTTVRVRPLSGREWQGTGPPGHLEGALTTLTTVRCLGMGGETVVAAGSEGGELLFWNLRTAELLYRVPARPGAVVGLAATEVDERPAMAVLRRAGTRDDGLPRVADCTRVAGTGVVVTGHPDGTVRIVDARSGQLLRVLPGHTGTVNALVCTPLDGRPAAVSGSEDCTVRVWDLSTGDCERLDMPGPVRSLCVTDDGAVAVGAGPEVVVLERVGSPEHPPT
ncbi:hypothetical protein [Streptomyces sp. NPDC005752]|uniref:hypothetical protein n=1 Tax=Streptomyces sp. NPDC005752 TaxID=3157065 RepID=UPI0033C1CA1E